MTNYYVADASEVPDLIEEHGLKWVAVVPLTDPRTATFEVRENNVHIALNCACCNNRHEVGDIEVVIAGTNDTVCDGCLRDYAPDVLAARERADSAVRAEIAATLQTVPADENDLF